MFNASTFLQSQTSEEGSTKRIAIPKGSYVGVCEPLNENSFRQNEARKEPGRFYVFLDLVWVLQVSEAVKAEIGRDRVTVRDSMIVDVNEQNTGLDFSKGKNISLNRRRDAVKQNQAGQPWNPSMLGGQMAMITVGHRSDGNDTYDQVDSVGKID